MKNWRSIPEIRLLSIALPLELLWEIAQFPLFTLWYEGSWPSILFALVHCTLGDLIIMFCAYSLVSLINKSRFWYQNKAAILLNGFLFTLFGLTYTVYSETINVSIRGTWEYTELMPMIPLLNVGSMPFLQWLIIPPLSLYFLILINKDPS